MTATEETLLLYEDENNAKDSINDELKPTKRKSLPPWKIWAISLLACLGNILLAFSYTLTSYVMHQYSYHSYTLALQGDTNQNESSNNVSSICSHNGSDVTKGSENTVQKLTAQWNLYSSLVAYLPAVILSTVLIPYSDTYGRRLFFIIPFVGAFLKSTLCALGIYFSINIDWFILFYFIEGCTGFWLSTLTIGGCIAADITNRGKERSFILSLLETSIGIGNFLSAMLSGYIIKWTQGYLIPEIIAVCVIVIGFLMVFLVLPETTSNTKHEPTKSTGCKNLKSMLEFYTTESSTSGNRLTYIMLLIIFILTCLNSFSERSLDTLYVLGSPFCWDSVLIGWYGASKTFISSIGGLVMVKTIHYCAKDDVVLLIGLISSTASLVVEALANTTAIMFVVPVVAFGNSMTMPMVRGLMSAMTPEHKQGSLFGGLAAVEAISHIISSVTSNTMYKETVTVFKGFTFLVMAGYGIIGMILCMWIIIRRKKSIKTVT